MFSHYSRVVAGVAGLATALGASVVLAPSTSAAPGHPGTPAAPVVLMHEGFGTGMSAGTATTLDKYAGNKYTADPPWLDTAQGNGLIVDGTTPDSAMVSEGFAGATSSGVTASTQGGEFRLLAQKLGDLNGTSPDTANFAVSAYTDGDPGAGKVEFATKNPLSLNANGRFLTISANVAVENCKRASAPLLKFYLMDGTTADAVNNTDLNPCTSASSDAPHAVTLTGGNAVLYSGNSVGIRMNNDNGSGHGNDHAYDDIKVLDVTPQLDKDFQKPAGDLHPGDVDNLVFTVTNTSELGEKTGWSFTDALANGLQVAGTATTTCAAGTVTAAKGATSIKVTAGSLAQGAKSCTITVPVTATTTGTFTNSASNITASTGLDAPGSTSVKYVPVSPAFTCSSPAMFDTSNMGFRDQSVGYDGITVSHNYGAAGFANNDGDPAPGSVQVADQDGNWQELVTPAGGPVDYGFLIGKTLTFNYKYTNNQTSSVVQNPVYMAIQSGGKRIYYVFKGQVDKDNKWHTVTVPMDPTKWVSGFQSNSSGGGPTGAAPSAATFASMLASVDELAFSMEGSNNLGDVTYFDDLGCAKPALSLTKTASPTKVTKAGQVVNYSFKVSNTGNVAIDNVKVDEGSFSGAGAMSAVTCPQTSLAAGANETCTATYTTTAADLSATSITNTATAAGTDPSGGAVKSAPAKAVVTVFHPELTLKKTASPTKVTKVGEVVDYSFKVSNTGNVTIDKVHVDEGSFSGAGQMSAVKCPQTSLAAGASETCTATYTTTAADLSATSITNTATAAGTDPSGGAVNSKPDTAVVTVFNPQLTLKKTASPTKVTKAGQTIDYSFKVSNTGNMAIDKVHVVEGSFSGSGHMSAVKCPQTSLAVGASETCTATYKTTAADLKAKSITNTATAAGTDPSGGAVASKPAKAVVTVFHPAMTLKKTATPTKVTHRGQKVHYRFHVRNTGNVTIHKVHVVEGSFSGAGHIGKVHCPKVTLAPGKSEVCTATYTVRTKDLRHKKLTNTAHAAGVAPGGAPVRSSKSKAVVKVHKHYRTPKAPDTGA